MKQTCKSSFALERADYELGGTGLLTRDLGLGGCAFPPITGSGFCSRKTVAYSCGAVAAFHRASRASRQQTAFLRTTLSALRRPRWPQRRAGKSPASNRKDNRDWI